MQNIHLALMTNPNSKQFHKPQVYLLLQYRWTDIPFSFEDNQIRTSSISPITFTVVLSNWITCQVDGLGCPFIFLQTESGITLTDAPESTKQLCTLWLKISKVRRNGGVLYLDLPPTLASPISSSSGWLSVGSFFSGTSSAFKKFFLFFIFIFFYFSAEAHYTFQTVRYLR